MKKVFATFLLLLYVISLSNYLMYRYGMERAEANLQKTLKAHTYSRADLFEIKIALHLPYSTDGKFEPYRGAVERNGIWYSYVARKVCLDTLVLLCIPNKEHTRLSIAARKAELSVESSIDGISSAAQKGFSFKKLRLSDDYIFGNTQNALSSNFEIKRCYGSNYSAKKEEVWIQILEVPPKTQVLTS